MFKKRPPEVCALRGRFVQTLYYNQKKENTMFNKFATIVLVAALVCTLAGTPAFASKPNQPVAKIEATADRPDEAGNVVNEELRTKILKLVADAKAGRNVVTFARPQIQPSQKNNLSTGAKIAIGVSIAVAVIAVIIVSKRCDNEPGAC